MFLLNDLKDGYLYNKRVIAGISKDNKNSKKDIAILTATMKVQEIYPLYDNILYKTNFRAFYSPYKFNTMKIKKLVTSDQKTIYSKIKTDLPTINVFRKELDLYKDLNLIYDLSEETMHNMTEYKVRGLQYINAYMNFLAMKYSSISYKDKIIAVPVFNNTNLANVTINNNENPFMIIYHAMFKNIMPKELEGANFLFYTEGGAFVKFKYSKDMKKADFLRFVSRVIKASNSKETVIEDEVPVNSTDTENIISSQVDKNDIIDGIKLTYLKNLGVNVNSNIGDTLQSNINDLNELIDSKIGSLNINFEKLTASDILKLLMNEPEVLQKSKIVSDLALKGKVNDMYVSKLRDAQSNVKINNKTLSEIINSAQSLSIEESVMESKEIVNNEVKYNRVMDFDASYQKKQMQKDMVNILTAFNNDEDVKLFVKDIKAEDTSDIFTKKMTYTVNFQDENKVSHTFKINYPILKDGKFIISGGGRKLILKQLFSYPIVKIKPDAVQIATNYNKLFIYRFGEKLNDGTEFVKKLLFQDLDEYIVKGSKFNYKRGNTTYKNKGFLTSLEYNEIAKNFAFIENKDYLISFNQQEIKKLKEKFNIKDIEFSNIFPVGIDKSTKDFIFANSETGEILIRDGLDLSKISNNLVIFIVDNILKNSLVEDKLKELYSYNPSKTLAYNRARITGRTIPIIILLAYEKGLKNILDRYGLEYEFIKSNRVPKAFGKKRMKFQDGYLVYNSLDLKATLLLDGLTLVNTENYSFEQMNTKEPYIEYFADVHGSRNIGKGLHNMLSLMIDPITRETLEQLELPTDIIDIILYANTLLCTSDFKPANDMSCYRLRGAEQVNAVLYKILADSFKTYKDTSNNGNPIKISVDPDILFKQLNALKTVDEYSILNPSLEIDKMSSVTYKGPVGLNSDDAYTTELRSYSPTMYGILSTPTPDSAKCGAVRQLSYDPKIINIRGMMDLDRSSRNRHTNLYCASELLNNFTATHADPPRIGMQTTCYIVGSSIKPIELLEHPY